MDRCKVFVYLLLLGLLTIPLRVTAFGFSFNFGGPGIRQVAPVVMPAVEDPANCLIAPSLCAVGVSPPTYTIHVIDDFTEAWSVNDQGVVAGQLSAAVTSDGYAHAALWVNGQLNDLGMVGCRSTVTLCWAMARAVNGGGVVVGDSHVDDIWLSPYPFTPLAPYYVHEVKWDNSGSYTMVAAIGAERGGLWDISENNHMIGNARSTDYNGANADYLDHAYLIDNGTVIEFGAYGQTSRATAVNNSGQATGSVDVTGVKYAFFWDGQILNALQLNEPAITRDINNQNPPLLVGATASGQGFVWRDGVYRKITDGNRSVINAVNDHGVMVGQVDGKAWIWTALGGDINTFVDAPAVLVDAVDINNEGEVLVRGSDNRFYLLKPTLPTSFF